MQTTEFPFSRVLHYAALAAASSAVMFLSGCEGRQEKLGEQVDEASEDIQKAHEKIAEGETELVEAKRELVDAKAEAEAGLEAPTPEDEPEVMATPDSTMTPAATATPVVTEVPAATATSVADFPPTPEPSPIGSE